MQVARINHPGAWGSDSLESDKFSKLDLMQGMAPMHQPQAASCDGSKIPAVLLKFVRRTHCVRAPIFIMDDPRRL